MHGRRTVKINIIFIGIVSFLFVLIIGKLLFVALSSNVDGINLTEFANNRNTKKETIVATRGTIFDSTGNILAQDVNSYTVIAYLSESRTEDPDKPYHVVDKEYTAKMLSPLINMTEERILSLLNYDAYQVELGPGGRGITELLKDEIDELSLPGIDFIKSTKRYYPLSDFASYTIGYAKTNDEGIINGEMGVELEYNDILNGKNGYKEYQQDMYGYQIVNTPAYKEPAENGYDIYLTLDTNVQMFTEQAISSLESAGCGWASISVADAKTGEILGVASSPSFDPNIKEISSYYDPFVSYEYEPGSTMKIFSFLAAMENGVYDGNETYRSGTITVDDATIKDWNNYGWGTITFNEGFMGSSNTAAVRLAQKLGKEKLHTFYEKLKYGTKTGVGLPNEQNGVIKFKYNTELAAASYGQGISVTAAQMVRALTTIANDGTMLKPYIVKKIINPTTGEIIEENKRKELGDVISKESIDAIKDLMRGVVDGRARMSTGTSYYIDGYDLIGKTGTAQIASTSGGYLKGSTNNIRSFAGLFPGNNPEVIVYAAVSKLQNSNALPNAVKTLVKDTATYLNIYNTSNGKTLDIITAKSYINKKTEEVIKEYENKNINLVVIGDGDKIIKQYPNKGVSINQNDKLFLLTNVNKYYMPNMTSWSKSDVNAFASLTNTKFTFNNYGYVVSTSKKEGEELISGETINVELNPKYKEELPEKKG